MDAVERTLIVARVRNLARSGEARQIREDAGVSGTLVAEALGVNEDTLWSWERGERSPRADVALRYAALLDQLRTVRT